MQTNFRAKTLMTANFAAVPLVIYRKVGLYSERQLMRNLGHWMDGKLSPKWQSSLLWAVAG